MRGTSYRKLGPNSEPLHGWVGLEANLKKLYGAFLDKQVHPAYFLHVRAPPDPCAPALLPRPRPLVFALDGCETQ